ncbi:hypothetical protein PAHAL_4G238000 [Panicum hallii]|uniref:Uncharacterized protein n=1 Tax=Panicum hallii TaxID=206008 RepID=A0A2T8JDU2_9POAL|nr:hypothetical protein PAHAL_4G238000 [Panicum hallii]
MASPRAESRRQGVGRTPHERKADAHLGKKRRRRLARAGEKARSDARTGRERELRAEEIACLCTHAGTPHRCSAPIERERRKERRGGREEDGGRTWNRAREKQREQRVCAGIARLHLPERPHLERVGEEGGGAGPQSSCTRNLVQRLPCLLLRPIQSAYIYIQALVGSCPVLSAPPPRPPSLLAVHVPLPLPSSAL